MASADANPRLSVGPPDALTAALMKRPTINAKLIPLQISAQQIGQQLQGATEAGRNPIGIGGMAANLAAALLNKRKLQGVQTELAQSQLSQRQALAQQFFPNDPNGQMLYLTDPDDATKALTMRYQPQDVRQGNTLINAPPSVAGSAGSPPGGYTAPTMVDDGGQMGTLTPAGFTSTGQRPANYAEQTAQASQQAAQARSEAETQQGAQGIQLQQQGLGIQAQQAQASLAQAAAAQAQARSSAVSAGAAQTNAGVNAGSTANFAPPAGFIIGARPPR